MVPDLPRPLVRISARLSNDSPGNVYAQVTGKDSVGLLAEIVRRFESCDLQPRRLVLRTRGEEVEDWFWLEPKDDRCADRATLCELERGWATRSGTFPV